MTLAMSPGYFHSIVFGCFVVIDFNTKESIYISLVSEYKSLFQWLNNFSIEELSLEEKTVPSTCGIHV